jgi:hypothetical protein
MKNKTMFSFLFLCVSFNCIAQLIQGTIKPGASTGKVEIWLKPNFSNTTQYLAQIGFPIAFPSTVSPLPTSLSVSLDAGFVSTFGSNYSVTVNSISQNTGGTEYYFNVVLVRSGSGSSNPQTWTSGTEFKVLTATFSDTSASAQVKLADYQDGGIDGMGNFYTTDGLANYFVTSNSSGNFYSAASLSQTGGNSSAGYAQTISNIALRTHPKQIIVYTDSESLNKIPLLTTMEIYPNPGHTIANVVLASPQKDNITFIITDINGLEKARQQATVTPGTNNITINIAKISPGYYLLKAVSQSGYKIAVEKFIRE